MKTRKPLRDINPCGFHYINPLMASFILGVLVSGLSVSEAFGQEESSGENVIYRQRTVYSFDGDTIDGDLMRPDGAYIEARKELQHSNLIRVREDFRDKVLESIVHL